MSSKVLGFVAIGLSSVALLLQIIGVAIPNWKTIKPHVSILPVISFDDQSTSEGLWKFCTSGVYGSIKTCQSYPGSGVSGFLHATRALEVVALLLMVCVIINVLLKMFLMKDKGILFSAGAEAAFTAGFFAVIGVILFGVKDLVGVGIANIIITQAINQNFGAGFILCIISSVFIISAGVVIIVMKKKENS